MVKKKKSVIEVIKTKKEVKEIILEKNRVRDGLKLFQTTVMLTLEDDSHFAQGPKIILMYSDT